MKAFERDRPPMFLLVHGAWHGAWCFSELAVELARRGLVSCALEMPGHGCDARLPGSGPVEVAAASARSPVADVDWNAGVAQLDAVAREIKASYGGPLILLGHSAGGLVISALAERDPTLFDELVYLCAFTTSVLNAYLMPENAGALLLPLLRADPAMIGAQRLDVRSNDPSYTAELRRTFLNDVDLSRADAALWHMLPDEPLFPDTVAITDGGWGSVPRSYIVAGRDNAIRPALQLRLVAEADTAAPSNPTRLFDIDSGHSPFLSAKKELADILEQIAGTVVERSGR